MSNDIMRSFGRVHGRKLSDEQTYFVENLLPKVEVDVSATLNIPALFDGQKQFCLEIGFGRGEHLAEFALQNPDIGCIGCEPFLNGVARILKYIHDGKIDNIRLLHGDARMLLEKTPDNSLDKVFILFPDPWPKAKHHKKRIINNAMLNELARVIKKGGVLEVATDHVEYGDWIAEHLDNSKNLDESEVTKNRRTTPPTDWISTNYQQKAERQGRGARFFHFVRT